jgi:hypothetical protein
MRTADVRAPAFQNLWSYEVPIGVVCLGSSSINLARRHRYTVVRDARVYTALLSPRRQDKNLVVTLANGVRKGKSSNRIVVYSTH